MINQLPEPTNTVPPPPPIPEPRSPDEIVCRPPPPAVPSPQPAVSSQEQLRPTKRRLRLQSTVEQLQLLQQLATSGEDISIAELCQRTRMMRATIYRHLKMLRNGRDITVKLKRGRKPKYSPELLKKCPPTCASKTKLRERRQLICTTRTSTTSLKRPSQSFQNPQFIGM